MQSYLEKFNNQYKGKHSIDIVFFNEEPLVMRYARFNQTGEVCSCNVESHIANQKVKNGWEQVECNENCKYRQKDENGKRACNRIGWLKFIIPSVCKDRIFLMRITGQKSLNRLNEYFNLQKAQGYSLIGKYKLFLKQEMQLNYLGQNFNNYVLDILKEEDFIQTENPQITEDVDKLSTENGENVNNYVAKMSNKQSIEEKPVTNVEKGVENQKVSVNEKDVNVESTDSKQDTENNFDNFYALYEMSKDTLKDKNGNEKEYLVAQFASKDDNLISVVIRPDDSEELSKCDIGTVVKLDIKEIGDRKYAMKLEYIEKITKKVAA